ncbi:MAG TPA: SDR family oxidoreductase [Aquella sp.]|nr:SDR family oxidoreductase [Aquella sp.]
MTISKMQFENQRVLIVGGTSGIGLATAKAFIDCGSDVVVASRSPKKIEMVLGTLGKKASGYIIDIQNDQDVECAINKFGEFNHVVVSAAPSPLPIGRTNSISMEDAINAMNTKFWGAYRIGRSVKLIHGGSLTFVSGILSIRPTKSSALLSAINAALDGLVRGLALELEPTRVNSVSPGILTSAAILANMTEEQRLEVINKLPVKKIGTPELIAEAILFLAGNPYVTGSNLVIDGGKSLV